jgi:hypothetical protein
MMAGETDMDLSSPSSSPLVGLKRSVADSTISDSELVSSSKLEDPDYHRNYYEKRYAEENYYGNYEREELLRSPKRISLDDRIELELGVQVKKDSMNNSMMPPQPQQIPVYQHTQAYQQYPQQYYQYYQQEGVAEFEPNYGAFDKQGLPIASGSANRSLIQVQTKSETNWDNPEAFIGHQSSASSRVVQVIYNFYFVKFN